MGATALHQPKRVGCHQSGECFFRNNPRENLATKSSPLVHRAICPCQIMQIAGRTAVIQEQVLWVPTVARFCHRLTGCPRGLRWHPMHRDRDVKRKQPRSGCFQAARQPASGGEKDLIRVMAVYAIPSVGGCCPNRFSTGCDKSFPKRWARSLSDLAASGAGLRHLKGKAKSQRPAWLGVWPRQYRNS